MTERPERVLVVTPHPDDAEIGCGGTVAKWISEGSEVFYVLCTNGDKGTSDPDMTTDRLAEIREREQQDAADYLGVSEVVYFGYPDGYLEDDHDFRGRLVREIRRLKPDVLFTTDPYRRSFYLHRDHRMCGQVSMDAVYPYSRDRLHYPAHEQEGLESHKVGDLYFWGTEAPDEFIDISDWVENKVEALKKHVSQVGGDDREGDVGDFLRANARRMGERAGVPYAEGFRRVRLRR